MKRLTVAVCLDDELGMMFNKRRQSRDRVLMADLIETAGGVIYAEPYSARILPEGCDHVLTEDPTRDAPEGSFCFIETLPLGRCIGDIERFVVYRWNRLYPADVYFDIDLEKEGFRLVSESEFAGSSHDKITKGIYER